ncbi:D-alanyl-D-alanine endopeptidase [Aquabacterium sp.]|uniref:D-alanyl-D-alanine endopeptidase n=1 Tax=Aquabacterium sp. TaxID=1872578 RepID=UPI0035B3F4C9
MMKKFKKSCLAVMLASVASLAVMSPSVAATAKSKTKKDDATQAVASKATRASSKTKVAASKSKSSKSKAVATASSKSARKVADNSANSKSKKTRQASVSKRTKSRSVSDAADTAVAVAPKPLVPVRVATPVKPVPAAAGVSAASGASFGQIYGLHHTQDPLDLKSSVALVMDQDTNEVLLAKNSEAVLPIASLTKLMTAMVVVEAHLPMEEPITVTSEDVDTEKNSSSRLAVGTTLTRGDLLHLALMSSENRAAHALGRTFPGGMSAFVVLMNRKANALGMGDTRYVDPTGLNSRNQSSARDLATLVKAAYQQPLIRQLSTSKEYAVQVGARQVQFHNTNGLVRSPSWDIGLQKTGYIVEAGRCLVMQARMAGRKLIMVFLDSTGKYSRQADAERVRRWIENATGTPRGSAVVAGPKVTS